MKKASVGRGFESELRASPQISAVLVAALGILLGAVAQPLGIQSQVTLLVPLLEVMAGLTWLLGQHRPHYAVWLAIGVVAALIVFADRWLSAPGALTLLSFPVLLAAALIGLRAATGAALAHTALLAALLVAPGQHSAAAAIVVALLSIWATWGGMVLIYRSVYGFAFWSWEHYRQAQVLLDEARNRKAELRQALEDLAAANRQLTRLNQLTQGLRQAAEEARLAKEQFVANVSHELRTPLNMVIGFSEMILQAPEAYGALPSTLLADLDVILRNSRHLSSLIDDVLDLSQIEAGRMALAREPVVVAELVEAAAIAVRPLYESRGLSLKVQVEADLPAVFCDRTRTREVLLNLLSNAGRFTEEGGVRVRVWREEPDVLFSVADTGPGIAAEDMGRIFRPFQQLDGSLHRRHDGSGLGLAISKSFVELHGGRMWLESEKGSGTTVYFRLPVDPPAPIEAGVTRWINPYLHYEERTHRPPSTGANRPRFVLLESNGLLQRLLTRYLDSVEIAPTMSFEEALEEIARAPAQALILNASMIGEDLQNLLRDGSLPYGTPAILCSIAGAFEAGGTPGVSDYLIKPVSREALLAAMDHLDLQGKTILVVDDEPEALQLFRRMLVSSGRGYRVLRAADGAQALHILRSQRPDALLMDLVMPEMDGFELLATKNADPALRGIPTIIISARDPVGQPILSSALAVTRGGGLSAPQLLNCIEALTRILSPGSPTAGPAPQAASAG